MPLPRYGVVIGTLIRFYRDPPDNFGHWYHGHIEVDTPSGLWTSALDVDTPTGLGISYRVSRNLQSSELGLVQGLPAGYHHLASNPSSGAVDYIRSTFLKDRFIWWEYTQFAGLAKTVQPLPPPIDPGDPPVMSPVPPLPRRLLEKFYRVIDVFSRWPWPWRFFRFRPWLKSDGNNALLALEQELISNRKVYIFGERFSGGGQGVHDVHQNQGDPAGSQWWDQNGIWQDGAVGVERADGSLFVWQVRFNSQATQTDNHGHPA